MIAETGCNASAVTVEGERCEDCNSGAGSGARTVTVGRGAARPLVIPGLLFRPLAALSDGIIDQCGKSESVPVPVIERSKCS